MAAEDFTAAGGSMAAGSMAAGFGAAGFGATFHNGRFFGGFTGFGYPYFGDYDYGGYGPPYSQTWYYCSVPAGSYPYVTECSTGWVAVPAS